MVCLGKRRTRWLILAFAEKPGEEPRAFLFVALIFAVLQDLFGFSLSNFFRPLLEIYSVHRKHHSMELFLYTFTNQVFGQCLIQFLRFLLIKTDFNHQFQLGFISAFKEIFNQPFMYSDLSHFIGIAFNFILAKDFAWIQRKQTLIHVIQQLSLMFQKTSVNEPTVFVGQLE